MNAEERVFNGNLGDYNWKDENGNSIDNKDLNSHFEAKVQNAMKEAVLKYMPIGSVLKVKNKLGLDMIIGYKYNSNGVEFDYLSVKYPGGITNNAQIHMFNHDDIERIYHVGMVDNIQMEYKKRLLEDDKGFNKTL